jgi:hypothetical protein
MAKKRSKKARSRAAKKAWRTRRAQKRLPRGHHRGQIGGVYASGWADEYIMKCRKCGRTIFGGPKGLRTHMRKSH